MEYNYDNLPEEWYVKADGSSDFKKLVIDYCNSIDPTLKWGGNNTSAYYGIYKNGKPMCTSVTGSHTLSLDDFKNILLMKSGLRTLPECWCVQDDGSQLFRDKVAVYLNAYPNSTKNFHTVRTINTPNNAYYGINPHLQFAAFINRTNERLPPDIVRLTLQEFISITENSQSNQSQNNECKHATSESRPNSTIRGHAINLSRKTPSIRTGQRPTGTAVPGRRRETANSVGHLSNRAFSV